MHALRTKAAVAMVMKMMAQNETIKRVLVNVFEVANPSVVAPEDVLSIVHLNAIFLEK